MRRAVVFALPLLLSACGYTPLYAPSEGAATAASHAQIGDVSMAHVEYNVGERRVAQTVSQRLQLAFPNQSADMDTVIVRITEDTSTLAVQQTATVQRAQINLKGEVEIQAPEGQTLLKATVRTSASYNVESTPYGTEAGKTSARLTAARNLADEITRRLALFYRTHPAAPATK